MISENREFAVDKHILISVMQSQAGTLGKALMEGVMNSIDAGATHVSVKLDAQSFRLKDDGRGFQSKEEVVKWFETFGTPHTAGDARFGKFRIGRGQLMSFAANDWRTGTFRMAVDIRSDSGVLGYHLTEGLSPVKGCSIGGKLYEELSPEALDEVVREFTDLVRYAEIPVSLNGKVISRKVSEQSWEEVTDDAYIKTSRTGDLLVYNLGVLVCKFANYEFGVGGVVVSRQALEVNFARNDILRHKCSVWKRIAEHLRTLGLRKVVAKPSLTRDERDFLARQWTYGSLPSELNTSIARVKLFTDATGRHCSLEDLVRAPTLTVAQASTARVGGKLHREGRAFVLSEDTLTRFRADNLEDLLDIVERRHNTRLHDKAAKLEDLALGCTETYKVFEDYALPAPIRLVLEALREKHKKFHQWFASGEKSSGIRELRAGDSDVALAWTDGSLFVALGLRELDKAATKGVQGCFEVLLTLTHEYCHDTADLESHEHDLVFLTKHHDLLQYHGARLLKLAEEVHRLYVRKARKAGVTMPESPQAQPSAAPARGAQSQAAAAFAAKQLPLFA
ncbi:hypothetical protein D3C71_24200 [compost metagenome]